MAHALKMGGMAAEAPTGDACKPQAPSAPSNLAVRPRIQFIFLENADGKASTASRKIARSYAARESHARARRERMAEYQDAKRREAEHFAAMSVYPSSNKETDPMTTAALQNANGGLGRRW